MPELNSALFEIICYENKCEMLSVKTFKITQNN